MHVKMARVEGYTFSTTVRVRFADTDAQGVAHNTAYLVWFEVARVEYLRTHAGGYQGLRDRGLEALVLESFCRYRVPARFDDVLHVHARCRGLRGARFRYEYAIERDDGTLVADAGEPAWSTTVSPGRRLASTVRWTSGEPCATSGAVVLSTLRPVGVP